jgi:hypothetical protein
VKNQGIPLLSFLCDLMGDEGLLAKFPEGAGS